MSLTRARNALGLLPSTTPRTGPGPLPLCTLRIAVALCWIVAAWRIVPAWADVPALSHPVGTGWIERLADSRLAAIGRIVALVASLALLLGVRARWAAGILAVIGVYLLGLAQLRGPVQHTHHLVWFAALLAVSPCDRALALAPSSPHPSDPTRTRWALWGAWSLLACIYFFPGLHKLLSQGPGWAEEHLRLTLHWKWTQAWDFAPLTRLDRHPTLLWLCGLGVLAFELGAPLLLWSRWTRLLLAVLALGFHASTALWMDIHFWHLAPLLVVLLPFPEARGESPRVRTGAVSTDPERTVGLERQGIPVRSIPSGTPRGTKGCAWKSRVGPLVAALVTGALVLGAVLAGLTKQTQAWPFACYPTFDRPIGPWMPTLAVRLQPSGMLLPEHTLADPELSKAFYARAWAIAGHYGVKQPAAAEGFWLRVRDRPAVRAHLAGVERVEVLSAWLHVDPDDARLRLGEVLWSGRP